MRTQNVENKATARTHGRNRSAGQVLRANCSGRSMTSVQSLRRRRRPSTERLALLVHFPSLGTPGEGRVRALLRTMSFDRSERTLAPALSRSTGRGRRGYDPLVIDSKQLLQDLTDPQREAATHVDGPLLIVAGAGSRCWSE